VRREKGKKKEAECSDEEKLIEIPRIISQPAGFRQAVCNKKCGQDSGSEG